MWTLKKGERAVRRERARRREEQNVAKRDEKKGLVGRGGNGTSIVR